MTKLENLHMYISEAYPSGRINELLDATIDTVLEGERKRITVYVEREMAFDKDAEKQSFRAGAYHSLVKCLAFIKLTPTN